MFTVLIDYDGYYYTEHVEAADIPSAILAASNSILEQLEYTDDYDIRHFVVNYRTIGVFAGHLINLWEI